MSDRTCLQCGESEAAAWRLRRSLTLWVRVVNEAHRQLARERGLR